MDKFFRPDIVEIESNHEIEPRTGILQCPNCESYYAIDKIGKVKIKLIGLNRKVVLESLRKRNLI